MKMKLIPRTKLIYKFSPWNKPVERASPGEFLIFETIDALGGQIKDESTTLDSIDWGKVNGSTGPVYIEGAEPGDTLIVDILDIRVDNRGVIVIVPGHGILGRRKEYKPKVKIVNIEGNFVYFNGTKVKVRPMIGTIGVAPADEEIPCGSLGRHGGNMDVKELGAGTRLYLPVFVNGALLAMGDLHAVQADGELCVSAVEVSGQVIVRVDLIKGKSVPWPILETSDAFQVLACADTLERACEIASEVAVNAISKALRIPFEKAYMLASLVVDLKINQVVDPRKGVRAVIPKEIVDNIEYFLCKP